MLVSSGGRSFGPPHVVRNLMNRIIRTNGFGAALVRLSLATTLRASSYLQCLIVRRATQFRMVHVLLKAISVSAENSTVRRENMPPGLRVTSSVVMGTSYSVV